MEIRAAGPDEIGKVRLLFHEYAAWLQEDICLHSFEQELTALPGAYGPPRGALLVASNGSQLAGCVALRPLQKDTAEMKRLFVRPQFRGNAVGPTLVTALIEEARRLSYRRVRLDTLPKMASAQRLYESIGFRDIARYNQNASTGVRFMELQL
jgi:ribosomal protein S18 acetylase RimI-like enzyme